MIKGINHSIIEVNETGNEYYERAILIIKPEYASAQRTVLEDEARKMLSELDVPSAVRFRRSRLKKLVLCSLCVGVGVLLGNVLSFLH